MSKEYQDSTVCPVCDEGVITICEYSDDFIGIDGKPFTVAGLECYVCDKCESTPIFQHQILRNHEKVTEARNGNL